MIKRLIASFICVTLGLSNLQYAQAQDFSINQLPVPGTMIGESLPFAPLSLKGLLINPQKPLEFQFIVDTGKGLQDTASIKEESNRLVKYFLAGLTIPEGELWVNLSPYEKDRITTASLGQTELGRDLLAQDYILKQLTASLIYPEKDLGKEFWSRVYSKAQAEFGTTNIPVNTFNKVWILPDQAQVYENGAAAYVTKSTLKVMLDEDYLAKQKHQVSARNDVGAVGANIVRQIVIPEITKEVNTGKNFAPLRQIYDAMILAKWYKETFVNGILDVLYTNKNKTEGVNLTDPSIREQIYQRYLQAYKKGVFNYIKETSTPDGQTMSRKYFSGGTLMKINDLEITHDQAMVSKILAAVTGAFLLLSVSCSVGHHNQHSKNSLFQKYKHPTTVNSKKPLPQKAEKSTVSAPQKSKDLKAQHKPLTQQGPKNPPARDTLLEAINRDFKAQKVPSFVPRQNPWVEPLHPPSNEPSAAASKLADAHAQAIINEIKRNGGGWRNESLEDSLFAMFGNPVALHYLDSEAVNMNTSLQKRYTEKKRDSAAYDYYVYRIMASGINNFFKDHPDPDTLINTYKKMSPGFKTIFLNLLNAQIKGKQPTVIDFWFSYDGKDFKYLRKHASDDQFRETIKNVHDRAMLSEAQAQKVVPPAKKIIPYWVYKGNVEKISTKLYGPDAAIAQKALKEMADKGDIKARLLFGLFHHQWQDGPLSDAMIEFGRLGTIEIIAQALSQAIAIEDANKALAYLEAGKQIRIQANVGALTRLVFQKNETGTVLNSKEPGKLMYYDKYIGNILSELGSEWWYNLKTIHKHFDKKKEVWVPEHISLEKFRHSDIVILRQSKKTQDAAMNALAKNGGIDLNQITIKRTGKTIQMQFDPTQLNELTQGGFEGLTPVITNITPISSPLQLLGIAS